MFTSSPLEAAALLPWPPARKRPAARAWVALLLALSLAPASLLAATWANPSGGDWSQHANWIPPDRPDNPGETATIPDDGQTYTVRLDMSCSADWVRLANPRATLSLNGFRFNLGSTQGFVNDGTLLANAGGSDIAQPFTNHAGGQVLVRGASYLGLSGATIVNDGSILVNPDGAHASMVLRFTGGGNINLTGSGEIVLRTSGDVNDAQVITYGGGGTLVQGADHVIRGEGTLNPRMTNLGLVSADVPGRRLSLTSEPMTNEAVFQAVGGGILALGAGAYTQGPNGRIRADAGVVECASSEIHGGTLETANDGRFLAVSGGTELFDLTNLGQFDVEGGSILYFEGSTIINDGTFRLNSDQVAANAVLYAHVAPITLAGGGAIVLRTAGDPSDAQLLGSAGGSLTQLAGHTIRGEGTVSVPLTNHGLVSADVPGRTLAVSGPQSNFGTFQAVGGGILRLGTGVLTQSAGGRILAEDARVECAAAEIHGGTLETYGTGAIVAVANSTWLLDLSILGRLDVEGGSALYFDGSRITDDGTVTLNSDRVSTNAVLHAYASEITLDGTGTLVLQTAGDPADAQVVGSAGGSLVQNADHTIRGEGTISAPLLSHGRVVADAAERALLLSTYPKTSDGLLRAENGALLDVTAALTNGGLAEATGGASFRATTPSGNYAAGTLTGGRWHVYDQSTMRLINADVRTLAAEILLEGAAANLYRDNATASALANLTGVSAGGSLEIRGGKALSVGGPLTNAGSVAVGTGSSLTCAGRYTQNGDPSSRGTTVNGTLVAADSVCVLGGRLSGGGIAAAHVRNAAQVAPGASPGTLTIDGSYVQTEAGELEIELAGTAPGHYDALQVGGAAALGGRLSVALLDGFSPHEGDTFTVLRYGSRVGQFREVVAPAQTDQWWETVYGPQQLDLVFHETGGSGMEEPSGETGLGLPAVAGLSVRPAPGGAVFELALPAAAQVDLVVYAVSGREVARPIEGTCAAGRHAILWRGDSRNGRRAPSGVYLATARIQGAERTETRTARFVVVR